MDNLLDLVVTHEARLRPAFVAVFAGVHVAAANGLRRRSVGLADVEVVAIVGFIVGRHAIRFFRVVGEGSRGVERIQ